MDDRGGGRGRLGGVAPFRRNYDEPRGGGRGYGRGRGRTGRGRGVSGNFHNSSTNLPSRDRTNLSNNPVHSERFEPSPTAAGRDRSDTIASESPDQSGYESGEIMPGPVRPAVVRRGSNASGDRVYNFHSSNASADSGRGAGGPGRSLDGRGSGQLGGRGRGRGRSYMERGGGRSGRGRTSGRGEDSGSGHHEELRRLAEPPREVEVRKDPPPFLRDNDWGRDRSPVPQRDSGISSSRRRYSDSDRDGPSRLYDDPDERFGKRPRDDVGYQVDHDEKRYRGNDYGPLAYRSADDGRPHAPLDLISRSIDDFRRVDERKAVDERRSMDDRRPADLRRDFDEPPYRDDTRDRLGSDDEAGRYHEARGRMREPTRGPGIPFDGPRAPPRDDMRGGPPRDDIGGPPPRDGLGGPPSRDNMRGPLPRDDIRGPPLRDERGPPSRDDMRGPPLRDERGPLPRDDIRGPPARDDMRGPPPRDDMRGPLPRDDIRGPPARDDMRGPPPRDDMRGPPPRDDMRGPPARDEMRGPPPRDDMRGPPARDEMRGPPPRDEMRGPPPRDEMRGPPSRDDMRGPPPRDDMRGPSPRDGIRGPPTRDDIRGPSARDDMRGPFLRDDVRGPPPRDDVRGPPPRDDLRGLPSRDDMRGPSPRDDMRAPTPRHDMRAPNPRDDVRGLHFRDDMRGLNSRDDTRGWPSRDDMRGAVPRDDMSSAAPRDDMSSAAPRDEMRGQRSRDDIRGPPPRDDMGGPPPRDDIRASVSRDDMRGRPTRDDMLGPPRDDMYGPPRENVRGPPTRDDIHGPPRDVMYGSPRDVVRIPTPRDDMRIPTPRDDMRIPTPRDDMRGPPPRDGPATRLPADESRGRMTYRGDDSPGRFRDDNRAGPAGFREGHGTAPGSFRDDRPGSFRDDGPRPPFRFESTIDPPYEPQRHESRPPEDLLYRRIGAREGSRDWPRDVHHEFPPGDVPQRRDMKDDFGRALPPNSTYDRPNRPSTEMDRGRDFPGGSDGFRDGPVSSQLQNENRSGRLGPPSSRDLMPQTEPFRHPGQLPFRDELRPMDMPTSDLSGPPIQSASRGSYGGRGRGRGQGGLGGGMDRGSGGSSEVDRFGSGRGSIDFRSDRDPSGVPLSNFRSLEGGGWHSRPEIRDGRPRGEYTGTPRDEPRRDLPLEPQSEINEAPPQTTPSCGEAGPTGTDKGPVKIEDEPQKPNPLRPLSPPPASKPSGVVMALARLADLEAQMEYAFVKHMLLVKRQRELQLQAKVLEHLPVGLEAIKDELAATTVERLQ